MPTAGHLGIHKIALCYSGAFEYMCTYSVSHVVIFHLYSLLRCINMLYTKTV